MQKKPTKSQGPKKPSGSQPAAVKLLKDEVKNQREADYKSMKKAQKELLDRQTEAYNAMVCDPRGSDPVRSITTQGGYPGLTGLYRCKARFTVAVGTSGVGYVVADPQVCGPRGGVNFYFYTGATFAGTGAATLATSGIGVVGQLWADAPFSAADVSPKELQGRLVASAIYLTPDSSVTNMSGTIHMLEFPGHYLGSAASWSIDSIKSHPRTRKIRAAQLGDPKILNVLNWHPQALGQSIQNNAGIQTIQNDSFFRSYQAATADPLNSASLCVIVSGEPGNTYDCEIWAVYEARGTRVMNPQPTYCNPMGEAVLWNAYSHKGLSGWNATTGEAVQAYTAAATHSAANILPGAHDLLKQSVGAGKMLLDTAKEIGGFFGAFM